MSGKTAAFLPELMRFADGRPVKTAEQWAERRKEILALFETYVYGKMPDAGQEKVTYRRSNFRVTSGFQEVNSGMEKTRRIKDWDTKIVSKRWGFR